MPFDLKGAPPTFQRLMNQELFTGHFRNFTMEHVKHLQLVFEGVQIHVLQCAPEKCHLGEREIVYLGHVVSTQSNQLQQLHLRQIQGAATPEDRPSLRSFLGLCNWLQTFEAIACDLMGPYPRTLTGNRFILVVTDPRARRPRFCASSKKTFSPGRVTLEL
jgi:hypothetical protein